MNSTIEKTVRSTHEAEYSQWLHHDLFSSHWWAILLISLLFLAVFSILIDRQRFLFILLVFFISFFVIGSLDEIGKFFGLWAYPHQFLVFTHRFNTVDFAILPVMVTLIYQYFSKWTYYLYAHTIHSAIVAFIGIPLFIKFHLYQMIHWNMFYGFLTLYATGLLIKYVCDAIRKKQKKSGMEL